MRTAYIIDFSNWCYRFRSVRVAQDPKYIPGIGPIDLSEYYGFMNAIHTIHGDAIYVVVDGTPKRQRELLPSYKANRDHEKPAVPTISHRYLLALIAREARTLGRELHIVGAPFREADEVIAYLVDDCLGLVDPSTRRNLAYAELHTPNDDPRIAEYLAGETMYQGGCFGYYYKPFDEVIIGSADSDLYQLKTHKTPVVLEPVTGRVFFDRSTSGKDIDRTDNTPAAVHHLPPHCIVVYKALFGDTSDGIPGVVPSRFGAPFRKFASTVSPAVFDALDYDLRYVNHPGRPMLSYDYKELGMPGIIDHLRSKPEDWHAYLRNLRLVELRGNAIATELFYGSDICDYAYKTYIK